MAIGVAQKMKNIFKDTIDLTIHTYDAVASEPFKIKKSVNIFVDGESVPIKIAISNEKMEAYLNEKIISSEPR
jgi:hypothetical protein